MEICKVNSQGELDENETEVEKKKVSVCLENLFDDKSQTENQKADCDMEAEKDGEIQGDAKTMDLSTQEL